MLRKVFVLLFKTLIECKASISHLILRTKAASGRLTSNTLTLMSTRVAVSRKGSTKTIPGLGNRNINYLCQRQDLENEMNIAKDTTERWAWGLYLKVTFIWVKTQVLAHILIKIWFWKWKYKLWISKTRPGPRWVASSKVVPQTTNLSYWHTWDNQSPRWVSFHINSFSVNILCLWTASNLNV